MRRRIITWVLLVAAIAFAAGCGGESVDQGPELGGADLAKNVSEVCRRSDKEFRRIQGKAPTSREEARVQGDALIKVSKEAIQELETLSPPPSLESAYDSYVDSRKLVLDQLEKGRKAAIDNDAEAYSSAKAAAAAGRADRVKLAQVIGATDCVGAPVKFGS